MVILYKLYSERNLVQRYETLREGETLSLGKFIFEMISRPTLSADTNLNHLGVIVCGEFCEWPTTFVFAQWWLTEAASCPRAQTS